MNDRQREYFRAKLLAWKDEILRESKITLQTLQEENVNHPDLADRASSETDRAIELRARDRQRKLISKIEAAIRRIDDGSYGYVAPAAGTGDCRDFVHTVYINGRPRVGKGSACRQGDSWKLNG